VVLKNMVVATTGIQIVTPWPAESKAYNMIAKHM
jgi:hypothetical protein